MWLDDLLYRVTYRTHNKIKLSYASTWAPPAVGVWAWEAWDDKTRVNTCNRCCVSHRWARLGFPHKRGQEMCTCRLSSKDSTALWVKQASSCSWFQCFYMNRGQEMCACRLSLKDSTLHYGWSRLVVVVGSNVPNEVMPIHKLKQAKHNKHETTKNITCGLIENYQKASNDIYTGLSLSHLPDCDDALWKSTRVDSGNRKICLVQVTTTTCLANLLNHHIQVHC